MHLIHNQDKSEFVSSAQNENVSLEQIIDLEKETINPTNMGKDTTNPDDKKIYRFAGYDLTEIELSRLDPTVLYGHGWLNDNLIEALASHFIKKTSYYLINCAVSYNMLFKGKQDILKRSKLDRYSALFGFVNLNLNQHWGFFFANRTSKTFYYLDPNKATSYEKNKSLKNWKNFIKIRTDISEEYESWTLGEFSHTKQTDGFNCGVICLKFLECILNNTFECVFDDAILKEYRSTLLEIVKANWRLKKITWEGEKTC